MVANGKICLTKTSDLLAATTFNPRRCLALFVRSITRPTLSGAELFP